MTRAAMPALAAACLAVSGAALAQSPTTEVSVSAGQSTDGTSASGVQVRLFGASRSDWRYFLEVAWGVTSDAESDAFSGAYPYDRRVRAVETYAERTFRPGGGIASVRIGRYRTPFGISSASDQAYVGFLRAPLIRYGENWALSNTFLEGGADVLIGTPSLGVEASVGTPQDQEGPGECRSRGLDVVVRGQAYFRSVVVGVSTIRSNPSFAQPWVHGRLAFQGIDARWMRNGVQVRGEWITGRPFDGVATDGGYVDVLVHPRMFGPVTAVGRVERLNYDAGLFSEYPRRLTAGARIRVMQGITAQVNALRTTGDTDGSSAHVFAFDVGLTFSRRF